MNLMRADAQNEL